MLAVEKELRGQRIGSKLVNLCLDRMRRSGCIYFCVGWMDVSCLVELQCNVSIT